MNQLLLKIITLLALHMLLVISLWGQKTSVEGLVIDGGTNEPLPFVHVVFTGTQQGTTTDSEGYFFLESDAEHSSVKISTVGYTPIEHEIQAGEHNEIEIRLESVSFGLDEVVVEADDGPMLRLLQKIRNNAERNDPENLESYAYQRYSRWDYQINNVTESMRDLGIFRNAQDAFQYTEDGMRFLPVYFSEQVVSNKIQKNPERRLSVIEADRTSGLGMLEDSEISGVTAGLRGGMNVYESSVRFLGQNFISPLASNGMFYYNYYLMDSVKTESGYDHVILFSPKRKGDNTLRGEMVVEDQFYSIRQIDAKLTNTAHLNFIKELSVYVSYQMANDSIPFYDESVITAVVDYVPIETRREHRVELKAVQQRKYSAVEIGLEKEVELSHRRLTYESVRSPDRHRKDDSYWRSVRPSELTMDDEVFIASIESINQLGFIRVMDKIARMTITGYYDFGYWELGPYDYLLNFNEVQGTHLFLGGRTGQKISEKYSIWGGVGYGTRNKKWLGRVGAGYLLPTSRRTLLEIEYTDDIIQVGENERILFLYENKQHTSETNILSHIFKRQTLKELQRRQRLKLEIEREIRTGFEISADLSFMRLHSPEFLPFLKNDLSVDQFENAEMSLNMRWSWDEQFFDYGYRRLYMGTDHPVVNMSIAGGFTNVSGSTSPYSRIHSTIKHQIYTGQARLNYALEGGLVFGEVPYPLLDIPRANITYGFQTYNFNMMDILEFLHDRYVRVYAEYRLNGFLFNRIPVIDRLGLREVFSFKGFVGGLHSRHESLLDFPQIISDENTQPYIELGFGIENLLRFFRVDGVWRATHHNGSPLGIRVRMEIKI